MSARHLIRTVAQHGPNVKLDDQKEKVMTQKYFFSFYFHSYRIHRIIKSKFFLTAAGVISPLLVFLSLSASFWKETTYHFELVFCWECHIRGRDAPNKGCTLYILVRELTILCSVSGGDLVVALTNTGRFRFNTNYFPYTWNTIKINCYFIVRGLICVIVSENGH